MTVPLTIGTEDEATAARAPYHQALTQVAHALQVKAMGRGGAPSFTSQDPQSQAHGIPEAGSSRSSSAPAKQAGPVPVAADVVSAVTETVTSRSPDIPDVLARHAAEMHQARYPINNFAGEGERAHYLNRIESMARAAILLLPLGSKNPEITVINSAAHKAMQEELARITPTPFAQNHKYVALDGGGLQKPDKVTLSHADEEILTIMQEKWDSGDGRKELIRALEHGRALTVEILDDLPLLVQEGNRPDFAHRPTAWKIAAIAAHHLLEQGEQTARARTRSIIKRLKETNLLQTQPSATSHTRTAPAETSPKPTPATTTRNGNITIATNQKPDSAHKWSRERAELRSTDEHAPTLDPNSTRSDIGSDTRGLKGGIPAKTRENSVEFFDLAGISAGKPMNFSSTYRPSWGASEDQGLDQLVPSPWIIEGEGKTVLVVSVKLEEERSAHVLESHNTAYTAQLEYLHNFLMGKSTDKIVVLWSEEPISEDLPRRLASRVQSDIWFHTGGVVPVRKNRAVNYWQLAPAKKRPGASRGQWQVARKGQIVAPLSPVILDGPWGSKADGEVLTHVIVDTQGNPIGRASFTMRDWKERDYGASYMNDPEFKIQQRGKWLPDLIKEIPWKGQRPYFFSSHCNGREIGIVTRDGSTLKVDGAVVGRWLKRRPSLKQLPPTTPIVIFACRSGWTDPDTGITLAQQVSNSTGRIVYAPTARVGQTNRKGVFYFRPDDIEGKEGIRWVTFIPEQ